MTAPDRFALHCRLSCLMAHDARKAVIFRRGPSRQTCLIAWDLASDTFKTGQWFKGSVYPERSALSADGEWLLVFMGNFRPPFATWTVLSRPPYFTAVALWPKGDTWGGGGFFLGKRDIVLRQSEIAEPTIGQLPRQFLAHLPTPDWEARIAKAAGQDPRGWRSLGDWRGPFRRSEGAVALTLNWETDLRGWGETPVYALAQSGRTMRLPGVDWADLDHDGDLLFARGGALYRLAQAQFAGLGAEQDLWQVARLLADFTPLRFQSVQAPYGAPTGRGVPARAHDGDDTVPPSGFEPVLDRITKEDRRARRRAREGGRRR